MTSLYNSEAKPFQSPWSGQICLNVASEVATDRKSKKAIFQSPWSGQICLNSDYDEPI